jgi:UDP-N-acetylglucosamine 2-epimerase (non-hydrolysing)
LLTAHRRENFGEPIRAIFRAVQRVVDRFEDVDVIYPVHPNPNVNVLAQEMLGNHPRICLVAPMDYFQFIDAMKNAELILTDSGGVQEEAPALGKPVLVLRDTTERMESVDQGHAVIVGTDEYSIYEKVSELLLNRQKLASLSKVGYLYGDGKAAYRITLELENSV